MSLIGRRPSPTGSQDPRPLRRRWRWFLGVVALTVAQGVAGSAGTHVAHASSSQGGAPQVVINPGGGALSNGSDGLKLVLNSAGGGNEYVVGQDQFYFAGTVQYCCSAGAPMLNIGGELFGQAGPAYNGSDWTSIAVSGVTGSTTTSTGTATGSGAATLTYTATKGGRTYTMARHLTYTFPNLYFSEGYTFTIPAGNTDVVKFYLGGDTAPGSSDQGYGIMLTDPVRSVISLNTSSHIQFGMREVGGDRPFTGARSGSFWDPYSDVAAGNDIVDHVDAFNHDAGLMVEWSLGSTPGTITANMEEFVVYQEASLTAQFRHDTFDAAAEEPFDFNLTNTLLADSSGNGFTFTFPTGMTIGTGAQTNTCGGTVGATTGGHVVTVSGVTVAATSNCVITIPVAVVAPGTYAVSHSSAASLQGDVVNRVGNATVTATASSNTAPTWVDQTLGAMSQNTYYNDGVVASGWPLPTFSISAGALPDGLTLDTATGTITGTPTGSGAYDFTVTASNSEGSIVKRFTGSVSGAPTAPAWTDQTLAGFQVGVAYSDGVAASGSPAPTYDVSAGALPGGLTLDTSTGAITGTPTTAGAYSFTVRANNDIGSPVTHAFSGSVLPANVAPTWTDQSLGAMQQGVPYADGVHATGYPTVAYSVSAGALPDGLTLDTTTGAITGTPTAAGAYSFSITVSNGVAPAAVVTFSGAVAPPNAAPGWTDDQVGEFQVGVVVVDGLQASGYPAVTYSVTAGSLPDGLALDATTGAITGTPTTAGPYDVTITAANGVGSPITVHLTGTVQPAASVGLELNIQVGAPTGSDETTATVHGEGLQPGAPYTVTLHSDPIELAHGIVGPDGTFSTTVTIPKDAPVGAHALLVTSTSPEGDPVVDTAWFSVTMAGTIGEVSHTAPVAEPPRDGGFFGVDPTRLLDTRADGSAYAAGSTHELTVIGRGGVPADAAAVVLNVAVDASDAPGFLTLFPCGTARPWVAGLTFAAGETVSNEVTVAPGTGGAVCIFSSATTHVIVDLDGAFSPSSGTGLVHVAGPSRLLDTRDAGTPVAAGQVVQLVPAGSAGVPADATAVVLHVAVDAPTAAGFVTVFPCGQAAPLTSNLNFDAGETTSNVAFAKLGAGGAVCLTSAVPTQLVVDLEAVFAPSGAGHLLASTPARVADTRATGAAGVGSVTVVRIAAAGAGVSAVALDVTADGGAVPGFVTAYACGAARPWASALNFGPGSPSSNAVVAPVAADGTVCLYTSSATDLVVDVQAIFGPLAAG